MGVFRGTAKLLLPLLAITAVYGTHKMAQANGLFPLMERGAKRPFPVIPATGTPLKTRWTGISQVDNLFAIMLQFFAPSLTGQSIPYTVQSIHFLGQLAAIYVLMIVESYRVGNAWRAVSFVTLFGLGAEWVAIAIVAPVYCFLHLMTSPMAGSMRTQPGAVRKTSLLIHPLELDVIPWAVSIGHIIPVVGMTFTAATVLSPLWKSQQFWILARLFHPITTSVAHLVLSMFGQVRTAPFASIEHRNRIVLRGLNKVYSFATYLALVPHLGTLAFIAVSYFSPSAFGSGYAEAFNPRTLWQPMAFWVDPMPQVESVVQGAHIFLQWDELVCCASMLVWAIAVNREGLSGYSDGSGFLSMLFRTALLTMVGGPATAAISLIRERDQILLDQIEEPDAAPPVAKEEPNQ